MPKPEKDQLGPSEEMLEITNAVEEGMANELFGDDQMQRAHGKIATRAIPGIGTAQAQYMDP
eukprot:2073966-Karenia_brevis.AAC.1